MNRALYKTTDAEREADIAHDKALIARVMAAMNEPLHMEPPPRQAEKRAPEGAVVAYILIFAAASVSLAIAAWLGGVL